MDDKKLREEKEMHRKKILKENEINYRKSRKRKEKGKIIVKKLSTVLDGVTEKNF